MSCVSMALAAFCYRLNGKVSTPKLLNAWLIENGGYLCLGSNCNNMVLKQVERVAADESIQFLGEVSSESWRLDRADAEN